MDGPAIDPQRGERSQDEPLHTNVGSKSVLPQSFLGGDRYMRQLLYDMTAIVRRLGPPSYFITFTANPPGDEIRLHLGRYQKPSDRPELVSRVFRLKFKSLLADLKAGVLGKHVANGWVIEYQKRRNLHVHIILSCGQKIGEIYQTQNTLTTLFLWNSQMKTKTPNYTTWSPPICYTVPVAPIHLLHV